MVRKRELKDKVGIANGGQSMSLGRQLRFFRTWSKLKVPSRDVLVCVNVFPL
jgi:hypothetical protein